MPGTPTRSARRAAAGSSTRRKSSSCVWRRLHDGNIIAEACPVRGMGYWRVAAYRTTKSSTTARDTRSFVLLREARERADELVRKHFNHECRTGVCGQWLRWPEE